MDSQFLDEQHEAKSSTRSDTGNARLVEAAERFLAELEEGG